MLNKAAKHIHYLFKDTKYFFLYIKRYYQGKYKHSCKFYKKEEIGAMLIKGKSIIRFGGGEIAFIHFLGIPFQKFDEQLRLDLLNIVKNYDNKSNYIMSIPLYVNYTNKIKTRG